MKLFILVIARRLVFFKEKYKVDEQILREFLSKGELTVRHVRCIIVGCEGAGKTTLLRRLENLTLKELTAINSTEVVDVHVNCFEVLEDEETIQRKCFSFSKNESKVIDMFWRIKVSGRLYQNTYLIIKT